MVAIEVHIPLLLLTQTLRTTEAIYTKPVLWPEDLFPDAPRRDVYAQPYFRPHHSLLEYSPVLQHATRDEDMSGRFWSHLVSANTLQSPCRTDQSRPSQSRAHGKPSFSASRLRLDTTINSALRAHIQLVIAERVVGASL